MSEYGEFCRDMRQFKRDRRSNWHECTSPGCQFGGNPVKVAPGRPCRHCGVTAPGERGRDVDLARSLAEHREEQAAEAAAEKRSRRELRTCPHCGKICKSRDGREHHVRMKHGGRHA